VSIDVGGFQLVVVAHAAQAKIGTTTSARLNAFRSVTRQLVSRKLRA
jgi:hypothetical protein